jgi:1-deoxy-D-xylulose-5-phosphate reductoisomerase
MNKGLEVIEAKWLFDLTPDQISVIIHPQSVIHSMVHFADGSVKAQLGVPDMRIPILYALSYPDRLSSDLPRLDFKNNQTLTFTEPELKKFRNLSLAYEALKKGGNMPCILNAANEIAVNAFLTEKIGFMQMPDVVEYTMENSLYSPSPDLDLLEVTDCNARETAINFINKLYKKR